MRVLVTGGAGFIGSHLCDALLDNGDSVVAIDDLSTGNLANLASAQAHSTFTFIEGTILDERAVEKALDRCDAIIHLAARIGLKAIVKSPLETLRVNALGTEVILNLASRRSIPTVIASTSEVYGLSVRIPSCEDDPICFGSPTIGRWSYACAKAYDEFYALALHRESKFPVVVARLFNTVGPRQTGMYGMVIPRFVEQALEGRPLTVYGDGSQTRCFCAVGDVVQALTTILTRMDRVAGEVFNIGNPREQTILDLAQTVIARTASTSRIKFVPFEKAYPAGFEEIMRRVPDIEKAQKTLDFSPTLRIEEILDLVVEDFRRLVRLK